MTAAEINPSFFFFLLSFSFFSVVPFLARMNGWIDSLIHWFALIVLIASVTLSCGTGRFPVPARVGLLRPRHVVRQVLALRRRRGRAQGLRQRTRLRWHRPPQPARELRLPLQRRVRRTYWNRYGTLNPSGGTNQWRTFFSFGCWNRAGHQHPPLRAFERRLPRWRQMRRLLELLERRSQPLPVRPRSGLRRQVPRVRLGRSGRPLHRWRSLYTWHFTTPISSH